MNKEATLIFPKLIELSDYGGNFTSYFQEVYNIFKAHFIDNAPRFTGIPVYSKKFPLTDGKFHRTFYHLTHEGDDEDDRTPDMRRMERIRYPKFIIDANSHSEILVWVELKKKEERIHVFHENEGYLFVLAKRKEFLLLHTAFYIAFNHQRRKKIDKYNAYKSQNRLAD